MFKYNESANCQLKVREVGHKVTVDVVVNLVNRVYIRIFSLSIEIMEDYRYVKTSSGQPIKSKR